MCNECLRSPCANTCPNNPNYDDERTVTCPLCGKEYDEGEMDYAVCDDCITRNSSFSAAIKYGESAQAEVSINGFYAKMLTQDQINEALNAIVMEFAQYYSSIAVNNARDFINDDPDNFADWLIEQKKH